MSITTLINSCFSVKHCLFLNWHWNAVTEKSQQHFSALCKLHLCRHTGEWAWGWSGWQHWSFPYHNDHRKIALSVVSITQLKLQNGFKRVNHEHYYNQSALLKDKIFFCFFFFYHQWAALIPHGVQGKHLQVPEQPAPPRAAPFWFRTCTRTGCPEQLWLEFTLRRNKFIQLFVGQYFSTRLTQLFLNLLSLKPLNTLHTVLTVPFP